MSFDWWPPGGPWPSTPGGVRGPDGRTLTDLYNVLSTVSGQLAALVTDSAAMRADLAYMRQLLFVLSGDPEDVPGGWFGLPLYMVTRVAGSPLLSSPAALHISLGAILGNVQQTNIRLEENGVPATPGALGVALDAAGTYLPILDLSRDIQNALLAVTGSITHDPSGSTIKDLLRSMDVNMLRTADCCEEGSTPPQPENPPPVEACADNDAVADSRVFAIDDPSPTLQASHPGGTVYALDFPEETGAGLLRDALASDEAGYSVYYFPEGHGTTDGCLTWDLTGNVAPPWSVAATLVEEVGGVWQSTYHYPIGEAFASEGGGTWSQGEETRFAFVIYRDDEPGIGKPGKNFFLSFAVSPA